jgi:hypothetical protein
MIVKSLWKVDVRVFNDNSMIDEVLRSSRDSTHKVKWNVGVNDFVLLFSLKRLS